MKKILFILLVMSLHVLSGFGQFSMVADDFAVSGNSQFNNGTGLSFFDFDKDGYDDLTLCDKNLPIRIFKNTQEGGFELIESIANSWEAKQPVWVDYDNDLDYDLFITFYHHTCMLYRNDGDITNMVDVTDDLNMPDSGNSFGSAWSDYDRDGYLDVYISNWMDDSDMVNTNWLMHNNGDGTFADVTQEKGVGNGTLSTFQGAWADFDLNGWPDLYVVNDHSMPNALYLNYEGNFTDISASSGTDIQINSMCDAIADYDRDGDFDIYVTNGYLGNYLLNNDGMVFSNVANLTGAAVHAQSWNAQWMDVDNDGFEDLHVCVGAATIPNKLLINQGDGSFTESDLETTTEVNWTYSAAKGDFNNDGYIDYANYSQLPTKVCLWKNQYEQVNHWIKFGLSSTLGHPDGYGTIIRCYVGDAAIMQTTFCGDNYISQDSQYKVIGLGQSTVVDSLVLTWPSGWVDKYYNVAADQFYAFIEGETFFLAQESMPQTTVCSGEQLTLSAGDYDSYLWSTGDDTQSITVNESGEYSVVVGSEWGFSQTLYFPVVVAVPIALVVTVTEPLCHGEATGSIHLNIEQQQVQNIAWTGIEEVATTEVNNLMAGSYAYQLTDQNGCEQDSALVLNEPTAIEVNWYAPLACNGEETIITTDIIGGIGAHTLDWNGADPEAVAAGEYELLVTDENLCVVTEQITIEQYDPISIDCIAPIACFNESTTVTAVVSGGALNYTLNWNGVNPDSIYAGDYTLDVVDENSCSASENFTVVESSEIFLTPEITNAFDGANGTVVMTVEGGNAPYTYLWSGGSTTNVLMDAVQGTYQCHVTDALLCYASTEVQVLDLAVGELLKTIDFYPSPFSDVLTIVQSDTQDMHIVNTSGQVLWHNISSKLASTIDTSDWATGIYFLFAGNQYHKLTKLR